MFTVADWTLCGDLLPVSMYAILNY